MRTTVTIDDELLAQAKVIAAQTHRTIGSVLEDALRKLISEQIGSTGDAYELPRLDFSRAGLQPGVDLQDKDAMADLLGDNAPA
jgi:predicted transcriptional regulator